MTRMLALTLAALLATAPARAEPNRQLTQSVANRLAPYGVVVDPAELSTAQAAALHLILVTKDRRGRIDIRRRAEAILSNPEFSD